MEFLGPPLASTQGHHSYVAIKLGPQKNDHVVGVGDFVHMKSDGPEPYVARVRDLAEKNGEKKVLAEWLLRPQERVIAEWLYRQQETKTINPRDFAHNEMLLAADYCDWNSTETIVEPVRVEIIDPRTTTFFKLLCFSDIVTPGKVSNEPRYRIARLYEKKTGVSGLTYAQVNGVFTTQLLARNRAEASLAVNRTPSPGMQQFASQPPELVHVNRADNGATGQPVIPQGVQRSEMPVSRQGLGPTLGHSLATQDPEEMRKRLRALIIHAAECVNSSCVEECRIQKGHFSHISNCRIRSGCAVCARFLRVLPDHRAHCTKPIGGCKVPFCSMIKIARTFEHAAACSTAACEIDACTDAKKMIAHARNCKAQYGSCIACGKLTEMLQVHDRTCGGFCQFPLCLFFAETLMHPKLTCTKPNCDQCFLFQKLVDGHVRTCSRTNACNFPSHAASLQPVAQAPVQVQMPPPKNSLRSIEPQYNDVQPLIRTVVSETDTSTQRRINGRSRTEGFRASKPNFVGSHAVTTMKAASNDGENRKRSRQGEAEDQEFQQTDTPQQPEQQTLSPPSILGQMSNQGNARHTSGEGKIRVGPAYQAIIPPYQNARPSDNSFKEKAIWIPQPDITLSLMEDQIQKKRIEISSTRGGIVNAILPGGDQGGCWVRITRPWKEGTSDIRVVPCELVWPKGSLGNFTVKHSATMFCVDLSSVRFPETIEEEILYNLFARKTGSPNVGVRGWPEILASWYESDFDAWSRCSYSEDPPMKIAQMCQRSVFEVNEFSWRRPSSRVLALGPSQLRCSLCKTSQIRLFPCKRYSVCHSVFCAECCQKLDQAKAKSNATSIPNQRNTASPVPVDLRPDRLICLLCRSQTPPTLSPAPRPQHIIPSETHQPSAAWMRHLGRIVVSQDNDVMVVSNTSPTIDAYPNNESVFEAYDERRITADQAVNLIRELLIARSKKTLGLLSGERRVQTSVG